MLIAALFKTAKTWRPPRCLPIDGWRNKLVHLDSGILFSGLNQWFYILFYYK